jgi:hypothetical protein
VFSDGATTCDNVVRVPGTRVSTGKFAPVAVEGDAAVLKQFFDPTKKTIWSGIYGIKYDTAYYERPAVRCGTLKGFSVISAP